MLRSLNIEDDYRFGFNGQHKENEVAGIGNHNSALFWEYDTRLGRRWNIDPKDQISISNYAVMGDNPIMMVDPLGDDKKSLSDIKSGKEKLDPVNDEIELPVTNVTAVRMNPKPTSSAPSEVSNSGLPQGHTELGGSGSLNLAQASALDIGRNDANRNKMNELNNFMQGFLFTGLSAPLLPVLGWELGGASALSDFAGQMYTAEGSPRERLKDWNPIASISAGVLRSPFLSSVPGGVVDLSINAFGGKKSMYNSPLELQTWKSIGLNTVGNMLGGHSGNLIRGGYSELGINLSKHGFGQFLGEQMGDVPSALIDNATNK